ncbi:MAG TPA: (2Fe-2S)-binding protein [Casimicrobiaceae bacterium]|nr:(2Fe-2S)-binding protein [Casimicrobiaceae bacterium]
MKRRAFLGSCAVMSGATSLASLAEAWADTPPRLYGRTRLIDIHGDPVRTKRLATETNYVFHYPYASTPCFLLRLTKAAPVRSLARQNGGNYAWNGGVGPERTVVAFSAICAHKLAYPTREVSFIRYQKERSDTSRGAVIHCCADHSIYDPVEGARVVSGPAPQPLAAIVLEHDAATDQLTAIGTIGAEQFDAFFQKYELRLGIEYGPGKAKQPIGDRAVVKELSNYCRTTIQC